MTDSGAGSEPLDGETAADIRAGLARILASDAFRAAPQLSAFLAFIVERAVAGRGPELKGYTIAVEAFGRSADFDPQSDPIVRVEAGRLRRALAQYYAGEGIGDPVRITIPVGAYVPAFERVEFGSAGQARLRPGLPPPAGEGPAGRLAPHAILASRPEEEALERRRARRWPLVAGLGLCAALLALVAWHGGIVGREPDAVVAMVPRPAASPLAASSSVAGLSMRPAQMETLVLAVTVSDLSENPAQSANARRFATFLVDALSRFDDLLTVKLPSPGQAIPGGADYVFELMAQPVPGGTEGFGRLRSVRDGRIVWSVSSVRPIDPDQADLPESARRLATRLAEPFGIIHADIRQYGAAEPTRCVYEAIDVRRTMLPEAHLSARRCLEDLVARDPTFYPAWAQLALLYTFEHGFGFNPQPEPLERALTAALTAVRLAPSSARAQLSLMSVLFKRGAIDEALKAGLVAMARNPYDPDIMATLGARYIQLNRPAEGLPLMEKAIALSAGRPPSYDFFALLGAHLLGARQVSRAHGEFLGGGSNPFALLGRAIRAVHTGNEEERVQAIATLCELFPMFHSQPRLWLTRRGFGAEVADRIVKDLGIVGH